MRCAFLPLSLSLSHTHTELRVCSVSGTHFPSGSRLSLPFPLFLSPPVWNARVDPCGRGRGRGHCPDPFPLRQPRTVGRYATATSSSSLSLSDSHAFVVLQARPLCATRSAARPHWSRATTSTMRWAPPAPLVLLSPCCTLFGRRSRAAPAPCYSQVGGKRGAGWPAQGPLRQGGGQQQHHLLLRH